MRLMTSMAALLALAAPALAQEAAEPTREERQAQSRVTEIAGPEPRLVQTPEGQPPSDAVVLFDGTGLDGWESVNGGPAEWIVEDGAMRVARVPNVGGRKRSEPEGCAYHITTSTSISAKASRTSRQWLRAGAKRLVTSAPIQTSTQPTRITVESMTREPSPPGAATRRRRGR